MREQDGGGGGVYREALVLRCPSNSEVTFWLGIRDGASILLREGRQRPRLAFSGGRSVWQLLCCPQPGI